MKRTGAVFFILWAAALLRGEASASLDMELYNQVFRNGEEWSYAGSGEAVLRFKAPRNPNVRGALELRFFPRDEGDSGSLPAFSLRKAYVKVRFPGLRLTLGKNRLSWGDGVVFNGGDVLFGSLDPVLDLTRRELRSETAWLTAVNVPLGNFAFFEGVALPPLSRDSGEAGPLEEASAGGRVYFTLGETKIEGGYLYKGEDPEEGGASGHRPYLSFQGNLGPDWYLSSSTALPQNLREDEDHPGWKESWNISFGLFHIQTLGRPEHSLQMRLESLWFPYREWEAAADADGRYGVYLYPELLWQRGNSLNYTLRSIISPLDGSASLTGGAGWTVYQGLTLQAYGTVYLGEEEDLFSWKRGEGETGRRGSTGISLLTGLRYSY